MNVLYLVGCVILNLAAAQDTYRAAIVRDVGRNQDLNAYIPAIHEAGRKNVDILVLPSADTLNSEYNYDEAVKNIAKAARVWRVSVAAPLVEDRARAALVVNREGAVIALQRKPVNSAVNYTASNEFDTFVSDFGVEFTMLMEEDLALQDPALMKTKNLIVTGSWPVEIPFLTAGPMSSAWSYISNSNVVSSVGIHGASTFTTERLVIADLHKNGRNDPSPPVVSSRLPAEDLSQYIIRPLDVEASATGYTETVCHHKFCCQFYVKASFKAGPTRSSLTFGLAAHAGARPLARRRHVGTQACAVLACAGLYKRTCDLGAQNSTDVIFHKLSVSANFTRHSAQYPLIESSDVITASQFSMHVANKHVTVTLHDASVITFGIFGRDFSKDHEAAIPEEFGTNGLFNENFQEFIDYVWIRLRILIFVVSIYILEMM